MVYFLPPGAKRSFEDAPWLNGELGAPASSSTTATSTYDTGYWGMGDGLEVTQADHASHYEKPPVVKNTPTSPEPSTRNLYYDYGSSSNQIPPNLALIRPTPSSLGWDLAHWNVKDFYEIVLPGKDGKRKEPELVLDECFPASDWTPRIVYLDKSLKASKHYHPCMYPGESCWKSGLGDRAAPAFGRAADLMRHYGHVHSRHYHEIYCDYNNCTRATPWNSFTRKDHYRDHLRDFHKEDVPRPSSGRESTQLAQKNIKSEWGTERKIDSKWRRCPKCLDRIYIAKRGWKCCGFECDKLRQEARIRLREEENDIKEKANFDSGSPFHVDTDWPLTEDLYPDLPGSYLSGYEDWDSGGYDSSGYYSMNYTVSAQSAKNDTLIWTAEGEPGIKSSRSELIVPPKPQQNEASQRHYYPPPPPDPKETIDLERPTSKSSPVLPFRNQQYTIRSKTGVSGSTTGTASDPQHKTPPATIHSESVSVQPLHELQRTASAESSGPTPRTSSSPYRVTDPETESSKSIAAGRGLNAQQIRISYEMPGSRNMPVSKPMPISTAIPGSRGLNIDTPDINIRNSLNSSPSKEVSLPIGQGMRNPGAIKRFIGKMRARFQ